MPNTVGMGSGRSLQSAMNLQVDETEERCYGFSGWLLHPFSDACPSHCLRIH
jgi:hypothetical protein